MRTFALVICVSAMLACTPNVRPDSYSIGSVGQVNRSVGGVIVSARSVHIDGSQGGGAAAGGAVGAMAGSQVGGSDAAGAVGAVGGLVIGAIAGAAAERRISSQTGMEYVVETVNGNLMTVVQGLDPALAPGQKVLILYGSPARVIADPRGAGR